MASSDDDSAGACGDDNDNNNNDDDYYGSDDKEARNWCHLFKNHKKSSDSLPVCLFVCCYDHITLFVIFLFCVVVADVFM